MLECRHFVLPYRYRTWRLVTLCDSARALLAFPCHWDRPAWISMTSVVLAIAINSRGDSMKDFNRAGT